MRVGKRVERVRHRAAGGLLVLALLVTTACQGSDAPSGSGGKTGKNKAAAAQVSITPANGATKVRPDGAVVVKVTGGRLDTVSVKAGKKNVPGTFNAERTEWRSSWTLSPSTKHSVTATAKNPDGIAAQGTSGFKTLTPSQTISTSLDWILESNRGKKYGVGMPIILNFSRAVFNKEAVEKALEVKAQKPVEGAWRWVGDQQVVYRPKTYWRANQKVRLTAHLSGVRAAKNVYALKDFNRTFQIGRSRISKVNLKTHKMTVKIDGKKARTVPISAGNGSTLEYTTTSGVHLTMEKGNPVRMIAPGRKKGDPGYYDELIGYAVRISNSGEYLHQTAGDYYCLGRANCSHGCVRQPAKDAIWFYRTVQPGDVVDITGSRRKLSWDNGWSFWQMPWKTWKKGSALS
ncbi:Ig-like domain-containing protein [Actinomadura sp. HBU206391]|uniref:L,D-transpeptidase n=1 Tax=Actinomadura sp. HBU206391 TaxID=2731692 RepID=UPI00164FE604|nr:Ig-like domain-containing protein [Actinomadura sp. HBU206391]MBC6460763.1 L,D-transpeptidase family protein [Actinomadura sp. HBU206391]